MTAPRLALGIVLLVGTAAISCYSERLPPPNFRYACTNDGDCDDPERCVQGLCQVPCTLATFEQTCGEASGNYVTCFNGVCSSTCDVNRPRCAGDQQCMSIPGFEFGGGGGGIFGGGGDDIELGLCGIECGTDSCPDGDVCLEGICVPTCDPTAAEDTCASGLVCTVGLCLPDDGSGSATTSTDTDGEGEGDTDTDSDTDSGTDTGGLQ